MNSITSGDGRSYDAHGLPEPCKLAVLLVLAVLIGLSALDDECRLGKGGCCGACAKASTGP